MSDDVTMASLSVRYGTPGMFQFQHRCGCYIDVPVDDLGIIKRCPVCERLFLPFKDGRVAGAGGGP